MRRHIFILFTLLLLFGTKLTLYGNVNGTITYDTTYHDLCQGQGIYLNDSLVTTAGTYHYCVTTTDSSVYCFCVIVSVHRTYSDTIRASICAGDTFSMYGFRATRTGSYTQYRRTVYGCDSTVTLILSVREPVNDTIRATTCSGEPYIGYGFNESQPGTYTHRGVSVEGCDSIVTLVLSVGTNYNDTIYATVNSGERYTENGIDEYEAGTYAITHKSTIGCDSNLTIILTQNIIDSIVNTHICQGDTFWFDSKPYTKPGTYTFSTSFGEEVCPYNITLNIDQSSAASLTVTDALMCADKGVLEIEYKYVSDNPAQTASIHFIRGAFRDTSGIPLYADSGIISIPLMAPTADSTNYPRPDIYMAALTIDNGVCRPTTVEFRFDILYPSWIIHQKWNDVLMVLNDKYNGGYVFTRFQWYQDGIRLEGEKEAYLYVPEHLDLNSEYWVELTREDDNKTIRTCAMTPQMRDDGYVEYANPYLTIYPTIVDRSQAVVTVNTNSKGEYWIYTPAGKLVEYNRYDAGESNSFELQLPYISNVYFVKFKADDSTTKTERIIVH